jgi:hypothetical protein
VQVLLDQDGLGHHGKRPAARRTGEPGNGRQEMKNQDGPGRAWHDRYNRTKSQKC